MKSGRVGGVGSVRRRPVDPHDVVSCQKGRGDLTGDLIHGGSMMPMHRAWVGLPVADIDM